MLKFSNLRLLKRRFSSQAALKWITPEKQELDTAYLLNKENVKEIEKNIQHRKGVGDINLIRSLQDKLSNLSNNDTAYEDIRQSLHGELLKIPNKTHPVVLEYGTEPKVVKYVNQKPTFDFKEMEFHEISKRLNLVRTEQLGNLSGNKSYYILGEMVELEQALINYFASKLHRDNFNLISVPDILHRRVIESCGMNTTGQRTQVYTLDQNVHEPNLCLSGTSEMALAGYFANKTLQEEDLPVKLMAISRCYRAETSSVAEERGIYRVHEFTKVEMFLISHPDNSDDLLEDLREKQEENFASLELHFQVLDMPAHELGAPAYRKYDVEAWLPGRKIYGEISSCSNCTDYQSRRLNIRYKTKNGDLKFVHTLNGTACAIPRLLIALTETGQSKNGTINVPKVLQPYMDSKTFIGRQKKIPELKLIKHKKQNSL